MPKIIKKIKSHFALFVSVLIVFSGLFVGVARSQVDSVCEISMRPGEKLQLRSWISCVMVSGTTDTATKLICGGENDKESVFIENASCNPPLNDYISHDGRMNGGLAALTGLAADRLTKDPLVPTNLAMYVDDTFGDTIFGTRSYAQVNLSQPADWFQAYTLDAWKYMRNWALSLLGVFLAIAALGILFRQKLSPQLVVTAANVLPMLPFALAGIVLSYPIVAVALNLVRPLVDLAVTVGMDALMAINNGNPSFTASGNSAAAMGLYGILGIFLTILFAGSWLAVGGIILSLPLIIVVLGVAIAVIYLLIKYIYEIVKVIITFILITLTMPFVSAMSVIPGKQGALLMMFKKLFANILVLPVITFTTILGFAFFLAMGQPNTVDNPANQSWIFIAGPGILIPLLKFFIGFAIIWNGLSARKYIENLLGVQGGIGSMLTGGGAPDPRKK